MSRMNFVNGIINKGYEEVNRSECPVDFGSDSYYFRKELDSGSFSYAMCNPDGRFIIWVSPKEDEVIKKFAPDAPR